MIFLQQHAEEAFWLQRSIQLLESLQELVTIDASEAKINLVANKFLKVKNPSDLVDRLNKIYRSDLQ
jgi:hypothetical protein